MQVKGKEIKARSMTWGERQKFIEAGLDYVFNPVKEDEDTLEMNKRFRSVQQFILTEVYKLSEDELNSVYENEVGPFVMKIIQLTNGRIEEETKN